MTVVYPKLPTNEFPDKDCGIRKFQPPVISAENHVTDPVVVVESSTPRSPPFDVKAGNQRGKLWTTTKAGPKQLLLALDHRRRQSQTKFNTGFELKVEESRD
jgi:hypothetical protein